MTLILTNMFIHMLTYVLTHVCTYLRTCLHSCLHLCLHLCLHIFSLMFTNMVTCLHTWLNTYKNCYTQYVQTCKILPNARLNLILSNIDLVLFTILHLQSGRVVRCLTPSMLNNNMIRTNWR